MTNDNLAYSLQLPTRIEFGWGKSAELGVLCRTVGRRALVLWGSQTIATGAVGQNLFQNLADQGLSPVNFATVRDEPSVEMIDDLTTQLRKLPVQPHDMIVAIGGGSAIDAGKALAAMATNTAGNSVQDYLEGVGKGLSLVNALLPIVAVPTTAGTGSEATKNAVISVHEPAVKKSLRHPLLIPRGILIDPQLTVSCSAQVTAHSGIDAITQCIESYVSCRANGMSQLLARDGAIRGILHLPTAVEQPNLPIARTNLSQAALLSGMALANSGLGLAHGVAAALGAIANVPHGLACAVMLPAAIRANQAAAERQFAELEWAVCGAQGLPRQQQTTAANDFHQRIADLCHALAVPTRLRDLGVVPAMLPELVAGSHGNSLAGNPRVIDDRELTQILEQML